MSSGLFSAADTESPLPQKVERSRCIGGPDHRFCTRLSNGSRPPVDLRRKYCEA